jgi:fatty acid desaturase
MRDADNFFHTRRGLQRFELASMLFAFAHDANHGSFLSAAQMRIEAALLYAFHYMIDLLFRCIYSHIDDHKFPSMD